MAEFTQVKRDIWQDPEFSELSAEAKLVYLYLITSPKLSTCGVIDMRLKQWAAHTSLPKSRTEQAVEELTMGQFVIVDADTEELLVRSYMKRSVSFASAPATIGVVRSWEKIESPKLRESVVNLLPEEAWKHESVDMPFDLPVHTPELGVSDAPHEGGDIDIPSTSPSTSEKKERHPKATQAGFKLWYEAYPRKTQRGDAQKAWAPAVTRAGSEQAILDGLQRLLPSLLAREKQYVPYPATWLRADGWLDEVDPPKAANLTAKEEAVERSHDRIKAGVQRAAELGLVASSQPEPRKELGR